MSGIAGIYRLDGRPVDVDVLRPMAEVVKHRGPDGIGYWTRGPVGMAHLQFCTTPESFRESQPTETSDRRYAITFDGRIDNRGELIQSLKPTGFVPDCPTDVDLVLSAYRHWGIKFVNHLVGDFAFALWDDIRRRLVCARDPLGTRIFHYYFDGRVLVFGTEIKQLFQNRSVSKDLDEQMLGVLLCGSFGDGEQTFYKRIRRLRGGNLLVANGGGISISRYWLPDPSQQIQRGSNKEYEEEFLEVFRQAVGSRLRVAGAAGLTVSGGLDSGSVAAISGELRRQEPGLCPELYAYTYSFDGYQDSEAPDTPVQVEAVCKASGLPLRWISVDGLWGLREIEGSRPPDEPLELPFNALNRLTFNRLRQDNIMVTLTGEGGDDLFSVGSRGHWQDWLQTMRIRSLWREMKGMPRSYKQAVLRRAARGLVPAPLARLKERSNGHVPPWVLPTFEKDVFLRERLESLSPQAGWARSYSEELRSELLYVGRSIAVLTSEQMSAEHGIESRHPFWDARLADLLLRLPPEQKYHRGVTKLLLRRAMSRYLPDIITARHKKSTFISLFERGFRDKEAPRIKALLEQPKLAQLGVVDGNELRDRYSQYLRGDDRRRGNLYWAVSAESWLRATFP